MAMRRRFYGEGLPVRELREQERVQTLWSGAPCQTNTAPQAMEEWWACGSGGPHWSLWAATHGAQETGG